MSRLISRLIVLFYILALVLFAGYVWARVTPLYPSN